MGYMKHYQDFVLEELDKKLKERGYAGFVVEMCPIRDSVWLTLLVDSKNKYRKEISMKEYNQMLIFEPDAWESLIEVMIDDWEWRKQKMENTYICDPNLNKECKKTGCHINGGECYVTTNPEYAKRDNIVDKIKLNNEEAK